MSITVIKFGGEIVETPTLLENLVLSVKKLHEQGEQVLLVHGGGPLATKLSERMGLSPKKVGGRRVTDQDTLEVMKMALPGISNSNILARMKSHKIPACAVSGINVVKARRRPPKAVSGSNGEVIDFGFVGDILDIETKLLTLLMCAGFIPVVNPLSADDDGQILNINADTVAFQIAKKIKAKKLALIAEVGGVFENLSDKSTRFTTLTIEAAKRKIKDGVIQGGMIPKLEEGFSVLESGLESFHIVGIATPETLLNEILNPGSVGTAVTRG